MSQNNTIVVDFKKCLLDMLKEAEKEKESLHNVYAWQFHSMADVYFGRIDALREVIARANMLNEIK